MEKLITIMRAESRSYKDKNGEPAFFNSVSVLMDGDLLDMSVSKILVDNILKHKEVIYKRELKCELKPKGFELISIAE